MDEYLALLDKLRKQGVLTHGRLMQAFRAIPRRHFLPKSLKALEGQDTALPIGQGQTISQPYTVAFMLQLLEVQQGNRVLDIGFGSGWTTALLAELVKPKGKVFAIEIIPEVCNFGKANIDAFGFLKKGIVETFCQDGSMGLPQKAPFDRILASAAGDKVPEVWITQLARGGKLVCPLGQSIWLFEKTNEGLTKREYPGFLFVPLTHEKH